MPQDVARRTCTGVHHRYTVTDHFFTMGFTDGVGVVARGEVSHFKPPLTVWAAECPRFPIRVPHGTKSNCAFLSRASVTLWPA